MLLVITGEKRVKAKCRRHPRRPAVARCSTCFAPLCRECARLANRRTYCRRHADALNVVAFAKGLQVSAIEAVSLRSQERAWRYTLLGGWFGLQRLYVGRHLGAGQVLAALVLGFVCGAAYFGREPDAAWLDVLAACGRYAIPAVGVGGAAILLLCTIGQSDLESPPLDANEAGMLLVAAIGAVMLLSLWNAQVNLAREYPFLVWYLGFNAMVGVLWMGDMARILHRDFRDADGLLVL